MATVKEIFGLETLSSFQCIIYYMDVILQHSLGGRGKCIVGPDSACGNISLSWAHP
jgi:hypothetical protein